MYKIMDKFYKKYRKKIMCINLVFFILLLKLLFLSGLNFAMNSDLRFAYVGSYNN